MNEGMKDVDMRMSSYEKRLKEMYNSKEFKGHNVHPICPMGMLVLMK